MSEPARVIIIDLQAWRFWGDCNICGKDRRLDHAVPYWCGPVHLEIGSKIRLADGTEQEVCGMPVCRSCHDEHEAARPAP